MAPKFIVLNNGLKDLSGHYFETSVSVAEAARDCGYTAILASHVACPGRLIPPWLEFYPLFCTDHWMSAPAAPPPDLGGLRGDAVALARTAFASSEDIPNYLRALFEEPTFSTPATPQKTWKDTVKAALRGALPPALVPVLRRLWRGRRTPVALARLLLPPTVYAGARALYRRLRPRPEPPAPVTPAVDPLAERLAGWAGLGEEFGHMLTFRRDLERLLCLTGAGAGDHVFLPTAHARELVAIQRLLAELPEAAAPSLHLEFRHALDIGVTAENPHFVHPYVLCHRTYFDFYRRQPPPPRVWLYTDTDELSEAYRAFSGLEFATLPIPFRTHLLGGPRVRDPNAPLCLAFFGDVRDEKRFDWLPDLADALAEDYLAPGRVRFLVQATLVHPEWNPASHRALGRLERLPPEHVRLVGRDGPLGPEEYYQLLSEADLLLCAYDPLAYSRRSSGTLTEAVAAGIPTVVPEGTWLERQQPRGTGESCRDLASFIAAVRRICDAYPHYRARAEEARARWLSVHTPRKLVEALLGRAAAPATSPLAA